MIIYKKKTIDHVIYINALSDATVSYLTGSTHEVITTTNNETAFTELTRVFEEQFENKVQETSVSKYPN